MRGDPAGSAPAADLPASAVPHGLRQAPTPAPQDARDGRPPDDDPGHDPVVEEVRAVRYALFAEAGDDLEEFGRQIRASHEAEGCAGVAPPPHQPEAPPGVGEPPRVPPPLGRTAPSAPAPPASSAIPPDPDAALVTAVLGHLRHLDDPERHLQWTTPKVPRSRVGWVRQVLGALRAAGAAVVYPAATDAHRPVPARGASDQHRGDASMSPAMQDAVGRMQALPVNAQDAIAPRLHDYLTRSEALRAMVQAGDDSGPVEPLHVDRIKREARAQAEPRT